MTDLISRAAVLNGISDLQKSPWYNDGKGGERHVQYLARKDAVEVLKVLCVEKEPAVDAAPVVHGRWIDHKDEHQCSACKGFTIVDAYVWMQLRYDYCPNCGANMDGERRNSERRDSDGMDA